MTDRHPVVFIHGLWLHASSWGRWVELFATYGYTAVAPGWPGDQPTVQASRDSGAVSGNGLGDVRDHFAEIAGSLPARPVLIGHGLGGLLALTLAGEVHAAGVIAIDAMPVTAMPPAHEPGGAPDAALSRDSFRVVYGAAVSREESDQLFERWSIPAPRWALCEPVIPDTLASRPHARITNSSPGPILLIASEGSQRGAGQYAWAEQSVLAAVNDVVVFPDRGPSLVIDSGWRSVAESCLSWMDAQEL